MDRNARPLSEMVVNLLPTPTSTLNEPAPWKEGVDWWLQSRATRNLEGVVTGNTPLLPSPVGRDHKGVPGQNVQMASLPREVSLLPTPSAGVFNDGEDLDSWERRRQENLAKGINGNGQGTPLSIAAQGIDSSAEAVQDWGRYEPAIRKWEAILGRSAPSPTLPGRTGPRLNPALAEWMMGLPEGWVTEVPKLFRKGQLKAIGNGVCIQQAIMALRMLLGE